MEVINHCQRQNEHQTKQQVVDTRGWIINGSKSNLEELSEKYNITNTTPNLCKDQKDLIPITSPPAHSLLKYILKAHIRPSKSILYIKYKCRGIEHHTTYTHHTY